MYLLSEGNQTYAQICDGVFTGVVMGSIIGLFFARLSQPVRPSGCLVGPLVMLGWFVVGLKMAALWLPGSTAPPGSTMLVLGFVCAGWVSLPRVTLLDLLALSAYSLGLSGLATWVASRDPAVPALPMLMLLGGFSSGAVLLASLAQLAGRERQPATRPTHELGNRLPPCALPEGASELPGTRRLFTDGQRAFCVWDTGRKAGLSLFLEGHWRSLGFESIVTGPDKQAFELVLQFGGVASGGLYLQSFGTAGDVFYRLDDLNFKAVRYRPEVTQWWYEVPRPA